jgi:hypothetical protein
MRRILIAIPFIISFGFIECSNKQHKEFKTFLTQLPKIETPITFNSNKEYNLKLLFLKDDSFFNKIQTELNGFGVFGKLFETENFIAILGNIPTDTGAPIILTYDKNGNKIDSHLIYSTVMGDMGHYTWNQEIISPNMRIEFTDSTITRKIKADGSNEIPGTDSLIVTRKNFRISEIGKLIEIK